MNDVAAGSRGWFGFDLDRTTAEYQPGDFRRYGPAHIGLPIPRMATRIRALLDSGAEVRIFTARVSGEHLSPERAEEARAARAAIQAWTLERLGVALPVTAEKDYDCIALYDDIAVQVIPNTGRVVQDVLRNIEYGAR